MNKNPFLQLVSHYKKDIDKEGLAIEFNKARHLNWGGAVFFWVERAKLEPIHENGLYSLRGTLYSEGKQIGCVEIYPDEIEDIDPAPVERLIAERRQFWKVEKLEESK